jgi:hypothetical protein
MYNPLSLSVLLCVSEIWTLREKYKKRLTSFEMKFLRIAAGYTSFGQKKNLEIVVKVEAEPVYEKLRRYKSNWQRHVRKERTTKICQK